MYVSFWSGAKGHILGFETDTKGALEAPKDTVPFCIDQARILIVVSWLFSMVGFHIHNKQALFFPLDVQRLWLCSILLKVL